MSGPSAKLPPDLGELFGDLFGQMLGQTGALAADLSVDLALTDAEAASGVTREVSFQRQRACATCEGRGTSDPAAMPDPCKECNATGRREVTQGFFKIAATCAACSGAGKTIKDPCGTCTGTGRVASEVMVPVVVPANVEHGTHITLDGEGSVGNDGTRGALLVYILVGDRADPRLEAFTAAHAAHAAAALNLPSAHIHRPPMPTWQVALIGIIALVLLAALLFVR